MKAHLQYLRYVLLHKFWVGYYCFGYRLFWRGIVHDLSKFSPTEWIPYVRRFYGEGKEGDYHDDSPANTYFRIAWNNHQKSNDHHWQWWILQNDDGTVELLPMSDKARREMMADWRGAGKVINGNSDPNKWYRANMKNIQLHKDTRYWVERELDRISYEGFKYVK